MDLLREVRSEHLIARRSKANPSLWPSTAIFITTDEGGGHYYSAISSPSTSSATTRIPFTSSRPYVRKGYVDHTYYDHVSVLKFIERNWGLPAISARSRDRLPNPVPSNASCLCPEKSPAIGDLMNFFKF